MSEHFTLINAKIVLEDSIIEHGFIIVNNGVITEVRSFSPDPTMESVIIDMEGDILMPGFIELHTDNLEKHLMPRPKTRMPVLPALLCHDNDCASSGITTVYDALAIGDAYDTSNNSVRGSGYAKILSALDFAIASNLLRADHYLHIRCELPASNVIQLFEELKEHKLIKLISIMDHTPGQKQFRNLSEARVYFKGKRGWSDSEFDMRVKNGPAVQEEFVKPHREYFVDHCRSNNITMASHDDTTPEHVREAKALDVALCEFPTTVEAASEARKEGMSNVMGAPNVVRGGSHSGNVSALELARVRLLDILSSDYVPCTLLIAVFQLVAQANFTLPQAVATVSSAPARAVGMSDRGSLKAGLRADIIRVRVVMHEGEQFPKVWSVWRAGTKVV
jgi:alpha-D-ribose 1-methylphosphonate 5-triphosphate diphosphatase